MFVSESVGGHRLFSINRLIAFVCSLKDFGFYVFRCFAEDQCARAAASLAYVTLLSLVPLLTVIFITLSAFPAFSSWADIVEAFIFENFVPALGTQIREYVLKFSENAKTLQAAGALFLLITVLMMMSTIEATFNVIWGVRRKRPIVVRFLLYWSLLTLGPVFLGAGMVVTSFVITANLFSTAPIGNFTSYGYISIIPLAATSAAFFLLFKLIPYRPVAFAHSLIGGVLAGALFELAKKVFALYIEYFPSQQVVYGAFAGIPIFLFWIYLSWTIILFGAEITKCLGTFRFNISKELNTNLEARILLCAYRILFQLYEAQNNIGALSEKQLADSDRRFSYEVVNACLIRLDAAGWISRNENFRWVLTRDLNRTSLYELVELLPTLDIWSEPEASCRHSAEDKLYLSLREFQISAKKKLDAPISSFIKKTET